MKKLIPSLLSADFWCLSEQLNVLLKHGLDTLHIDVMDGVFVPNISLGTPIVASLSQRSHFILDVHLMIEDPEKMVQAFKEAGAHIITVHWEASPHIHRTLQRIKEIGAMAGVSINPGTPVDVLRPVLHLVDLVLVMSVNPGFGGQEFLPEVLPKIEKLKEWQSSYQYVIEVDGGMNPQTAALAIQSGAQWIVAGSSVFRGNVEQNVVDLLKVLK
ncbi:ribulose-phosphate 3-epimerase [Coprothermobacteraceae bacterium]|nr:ribulose-phosphate 3-epimerase [Coprothermobacteraceae bacterium]